MVLRTLRELLGMDQLQCFVDNHKAGMIVCGKPVIDFTELKRIYKSYTVLVTVSKPRLLSEVVTQLHSFNIPFIIFDDRYRLQLVKEKIKTDKAYYRREPLKTPPRFHADMA